VTTDETCIAPTVLAKLCDPDRVAFATVGEGANLALIVFRSEGDAERFQRASGKHTPEQGFKRGGLDHVALSDVLEAGGYPLVAMPEAWTGEGGADTFVAGAFVDMLKESRSR
jgi:hypothetical protein